VFKKTLETPVEKLTRGTLFAERYEIIEELGRGGMGTVYRAEDKKANEEIGLKLIKPEIAAQKRQSKDSVMSSRRRVKLGIRTSAGCTTWASIGELTT
jgi:hypothetical protein